MRGWFSFSPHLHSANGRRFAVIGNTTAWKWSPSVFWCRRPTSSCSPPCASHRSAMSHQQRGEHSDRDDHGDAFPLGRTGRQANRGRCRDGSWGGGACSGLTVPFYNLGSTGSLSRARTPKTHSWTRRNGSRRTNRSRASRPRANSERASDRLRPSPRARSGASFSRRCIPGRR